MTMFWMVWNEGNRDPRYKHPTEDDARKEAERLARQFPGQKFYLLESKDCCSYNEVRWSSERCQTGEPF